MAASVSAKQFSSAIFSLSLSFVWCMKECVRASVPVHVCVRTCLCVLATDRVSLQLLQPSVRVFVWVFPLCSPLQPTNEAILPSPQLTPMNSIFVDPEGGGCREKRQVFLSSWTKSNSKRVHDDVSVIMSCNSSVDDGESS